MCGIAGTLVPEHLGGVSFDVLHDMTSSISHRGPDDEGYYLNPEHTVGLGHRRLSIIDLHQGKQPISSLDGKRHIIFNGEIYNYRELRQRLVARGHHFRTQTDTEVILRLYEERGLACFSELNGIYAVAIYDEYSHTIHLARDPFGVKPLYYATKDGCLAFGSEIKSVLASGLVEKNIDCSALDRFLDYRFNPAPQTLLQDVQKLPAGCIMSMHRDGSIQRQALRTDVPRTRNSMKEEEALEEYQRLLQLAVQRQLVSDVPVGVLLSGGLDSAIIASHMVQNSSTRVRSYTVGFEGKGDFNELDDARESARILGTDHSEVLLSRNDYLRLFEQAFYFLEEPIAMTTVPAMFAVSERAARDVKVVLAGQGADEPLAGYPRYRGEKLMSDFGWLLSRVPLKKLTSVFPRNEKLKRLAYSSSFRSELDRFRAIHTIFQPSLKQKLLRPEVQEKLQDQSDEILETLYRNSAAMEDSLSRLLYIDTRMQLADNLLLFNDKMSMAHSLEMRVPFLDHELVDFLETVPSHLKIKGKVQKYIHKKACERTLPHAIVHRPKRGFDTPMDQWLQNDFSKVVQRLFNEHDSAVRQYFNMQTINQMLLLHQTRRENFQRHLFALLSFELWHRHFYSSLRNPSSFQSADNFALVS